MAYFNWEEKYTVGVSQIDTQHKRLFDLINNLYDAMKEGKGKQVTGEVLHGLVDYTKTHFQYEESLMEKYGYPITSLLPHQIEHKNLMVKVNEFNQKYQQNGMGMATEVGSFLKDWLSNHILVNDKKYAPFFANKNLN